MKKPAKKQNPEPAAEQHPTVRFVLANVTRATEPPTPITVTFWSKEQQA